MEATLEMEGILRVGATRVMEATEGTLRNGGNGGNARLIMADEATGETEGMGEMHDYVSEN